MSERKVWTGEQFQEAARRASTLAHEALLVDGAHHKQWHLEEIIRALGIDPEAMPEKLGSNFDYVRGIKP